MLNAYRGEPNDRSAVAPEFWYYYPAKVLGVDMIEFEREVPFHLALKETFARFECEGWGIAFPEARPQDVDVRSEESWVEEGRLQSRQIIKTPYGTVESVSQFDREEPCWLLHRPVVDPARDLKAWLYYAMPEPEALQLESMIQAYHEVGDSYLLEGWLGTAFFDFYAEAREGGFEQGIMDFYENEAAMERLQKEYIDYMVQKAEYLCRHTPFESFFIGCSWSCNSLIGPQMWRRWDKPVLDAIGKAIHKHNKLLHVHFHGKSRETLHDFAEISVDCICPFERPPGGDIKGREGLEEVATALGGKVTMSGNVHTVETLIRGSEDTVRQEVREILDVFRGNPRVIVGSGDQVGRETPEENLYAMIDEAKTYYNP